MAPLLLALALLLGDEASALVEEFKRFYAKDKTPRERYEAVQVLAQADSLAAVQALAPVLEDEDFGVRRGAIDVLASYKSEDGARWLVDEVLLAKKNARKVVLRAGAAEALGGMRPAFAYEPLVTLLGEKDVSLKFAGLAALARLRNPSSAEVIAPFASDPDGALAIAALDALVAVGNKSGAEPPIVAALSHADWRVRSRAIQAVVQLRLVGGVAPLIGMLTSEEGRLAGDAYVALKELTFNEFVDDPAIWSKWWERNRTSYELPDPVRYKAALEALRSQGGKYTVAKGKAKEFLTIATRSDNILFVIDVSGSMEVPFGDISRLEATGRTYKSTQRLAIVKEELINTIATLPETTGFNVYAFASGLTRWHDDLVRANVLNKSGAADWIEKLKPLGGAKQTYRTQGGLVSRGGDDGQTNTWLALTSALGVTEEEAKKADGTAGYVTKPSGSPVDTIYFLTDGEPTVGKSLDMREIRAEVRRLNQYRSVTIHVIYVGEFGGQELKEMALENNGIFVSIGG